MIPETSSILSALYEKKQWYAIQVARKYKIDISNEYLEQLRKDFDAYANYIYYLFGINKYVEEAVKICENHLEYEKVAAGMGKQLGVGRTDHCCFRRKYSEKIVSRLLVSAVAVIIIAVDVIVMIKKMKEMLEYVIKMRIIYR